MDVQVLRLATSVPGEPTWRELTAAGDPLQLRVTHQLDVATSALTFQFQARNRLTIEIKNAGIKCAAGRSHKPSTCSLLQNHVLCVIPLLISHAHAFFSKNTLYVACNKDLPSKMFIKCRLAFGGPMVPAIKLPPVHKLASIPAGEALTWRLGFKVLGFGRLSVQAFILLPARVAVLPGEKLQ